MVLLNHTFIENEILTAVTVHFPIKLVSPTMGPLLKSMWSPTRYKTTVFPIKRKLNILAYLAWHNMSTTFNNSRKKTYLANMRTQDRIWYTIRYIPFTVIPMICEPCVMHKTWKLLFHVAVHFVPPTVFF